MGNQAEVIWREKNTTGIWIIQIQQDQIWSCISNLKQKNLGIINSVSPTNAQLNQSKSPTQSKSQKNLNNFVELSHVTKAEIIWCLKCVQQIWSFNSMCDMSELFQLIFPATTADKFSLGKTKYMHAINYGLSPYFFGELLRSIKSCGEVVCFDEVLNKIVQKCQMDNTIRYYDNDINKVASCYFSSSFLGSSSAKDILESCLEFANKLDIQMILQISMDGPNVNWSFLRLF